MEPQSARPSTLRIAVASLATAAIAAGVGFAAIYMTLGRPDNAPSSVSDKTVPPAKTPEQAGSPPQDLPKGPGSNPLSKGQMAAFVFRSEPQALPEIKFQDAEGKVRTLADWRGKVVLLNLWATWCLPCRQEMPALDRLQKALGSDKFEVVALSVDRKGVDASKKFLDDIKTGLPLYVDPTARAYADLRAVGLPATLLIDAQGREIGRLLGPAEWDGEDAMGLIRAVLLQPT
jgi:thiol-disulfide isomerase/thioredoxin